MYYWNKVIRKTQIKVFVPMNRRLTEMQREISKDALSILFRSEEQKAH
jgi:hypothetical protein